MAHVVALDAQRRLIQSQVLGQLVQRTGATVVIGAALESVPHQRLAGVVLRSFHQSALVPTLRHPKRHPRAPLAAEPVLVQPDTRRKRRHHHALRPSQRVLVVVQLLEHPGHKCRTVQLLHFVHDEASLAHHAALADEEQLDCRFELVVADADDVEVLTARPSNLLLLDRPPDTGQPVPQPSRQLEFELDRGVGHSLLKVVHHCVGVAFEKANQLSDQPVVVVPSDLADARSSALLDVVQQARPAEPLVGGQLAVAAGADRERSQQQIQRFADGIGVPVRAEVPIPALATAAHHHRPRPFVKQRHRQERVRLVVSKPHVESRLMPLDEAVLEHERVDLGGNLNPLHRSGRGHHLGCPVMKPPRIPEVAVQARAKILGLADVDDPSVSIEKLIAARCIWHRTRIRSQAHARRLSALKPSKCTPLAQRVARRPAHQACVEERWTRRGRVVSCADGRSDRGSPAPACPPKSERCGDSAPRSCAGGCKIWNSHTSGTQTRT